MHRKDPCKKKRKGSPGSNPRLAKIPSYISEVTTSTTNVGDLRDSQSSNDLINDNLEGGSRSKVDFSDPDDDIMEVEREVCKEIQQIIEFSDSEEEN